MQTIKLLKRVSSPNNPHKSHIWKTWSQTPHCGLNEGFIIHMILIVCSSDFNLDYVDYVDYLNDKQSQLKPHTIHISLPGLKISDQNSPNFYHF